MEEPWASTKDPWAGPMGNPWAIYGRHMGHNPWVSTENPWKTWARRWGTNATSWVTRGRLTGDPRVTHG